MNKLGECCPLHSGVWTLGGQGQAFQEGPVADGISASWPGSLPHAQAGVLGGTNGAGNS